MAVDYRTLNFEDRRSAQMAAFEAEQRGEAARKDGDNAQAADEYESAERIRRWEHRNFGVERLGF